MTVLAQRQTEIKQGTLVRAGGPLIGQEFFWIHDQTGRLWAWWIAYSLMPDWNIAPEKVFDQEVRFHLVPWWILLSDSEASLWYVYPEVDGSPLVATGRPTLGEGITNSPKLRVRGGLARYQYRILGGGLDVVAI